MEMAELVSRFHNVPSTHSNSQMHRVSTPVLFRRRAMPYMPIYPVLQFSSLSDSALVDWRQDASVLSAKDQSTPESLKCQVSLPEFLLTIA